MKKVIRLSATVILGGCLFAGALALQYGAQVRIESPDGRYREVRVRTGNEVRIVRNLSDTRCVLGRNWGYDSNRIWVDNGCRAVFAYGTNARWDDRYGRNDRWDDRYGRNDDHDCCAGHRDGGSHSRDCEHYGRDDRWDGRYDDRYREGNWRRVRLESNDGRRVSRFIPNRGVHLLRQLSSRPCREGRSWGSSSVGIWVDDGCRAEFEVRPR